MMLFVLVRSEKMRQQTGTDQRTRTDPLPHTVRLAPTARPTGKHWYLRMRLAHSEPRCFRVLLPKRWTQAIDVTAKSSPTDVDARQPFSLIN